MKGHGTASEILIMNWNKLSEKLLNGHSATQDEALAILGSDDNELLAVLHAVSKLDKAVIGCSLTLETSQKELGVLREVKVSVALAPNKQVRTPVRRRRLERFSEVVGVRVEEEHSSSESVIRFDSIGSLDASFLHTAVL